jgi:hypothetical protein
VSFRIRQPQSCNRDRGGCNRDGGGGSKRLGAGGVEGVEWLGRVGGLGGVVTVHLKHLSAEDLSVEDALAVHTLSNSILLFVLVH